MAKPIKKSNSQNNLKQASLTGHPLTLEQKDHFSPDLGLLGPKLGDFFFFLQKVEVSALLDVTHVSMLCNIKET